MMIRPAELAAIKAGTIDLAFRRWARPRVAVGTQMRTAVGLVEVTSVDQVRALRALGVTTLEQVAGYSTADLAAIHGVGPIAIDRLRAALAELHAEALSGRAGPRPDHP